uniref:SET domain-containing protein n=1 Tax=Leersia perrieri TaxID=77586 RepID=A0A0D9VPZ8_9ORYZ
MAAVDDDSLQQLRSRATQLLLKENWHDYIAVCSLIVNAAAAAAGDRRAARSGAVDFTDWVLAGFAGKCPDLAEHVGAVEIRRRANHGGRRRGLFAARNIESGATLMISKAVAVGRGVIPHDAADDGGEKMVVWKELIDKVLDAAEKSPTTASLIYTLSTGDEDEDEHDLPVPDIARFKQQQDELDDGAAMAAAPLDVDKILKVLDVNCLTEEASPSANLLGSNGVVNCGVGLWILPAFINHSCHPNARRTHAGDHAIVHASRDIKAGEEITFAYFDVLTPLIKRREAARAWGFECHCDRCVFEAGGGDAVLGQELTNLENELVNGRGDMGELVVRLEEKMRKSMVKERRKGFLRASFWNAYSALFDSDKLMRKWGRRVPGEAAVAESVAGAIGGNESVLKAMLRGADNGNGCGNRLEVEDKVVRIGRATYGKIVKRQAMRALFRLTLDGDIVIKDRISTFIKTSVTEITTLIYTEPFMNSLMEEAHAMPVTSFFPLAGIHKLIAIFLVVLSWILVHKWSLRNQKGPRSWPIIGATVEQLKNYHRMHDWLVEYLSKYRTVTVDMPFTSYTYIADPVNVEHVLKTNFTNYPKGEVYRSYMDVLLGDGIFNADGEMWRKQRKTASFEFASKNLRDFSTVVFREYSLKLSSILNQACKESRVVDMQELFMRMTLDSICKVGFGVEIGTLSPDLPENSFAQAFDAANIIVTLRFIDPLWRLKKFLHVGSEALLEQSMKLVDDFTYSVIRRRKAEIVQARASGKQEKIKHDILSRFIELGESGDGDGDGGEGGISSFGDEKSLRDVVLNFVIAGRDTTATTLSWFTYMAMTHPSVADKLRRELTAFESDRAAEEGITLLPTTPTPHRIAQFASLLSYDSLGKLNYLHACVTETLRLYPAVPQDPKGIVEDDVLPDGTRVRAGGMVTYVPYSMGRMEYNWGPDAASFVPERWLTGDGGGFRNASPFKFTAFQAGPRICLGKDSAYLQMKMALAILFRFYRFELVENHPVKYRMMTILSMAHGLKVRVSASL